MRYGKNSRAKHPANSHVKHGSIAVQQVFEVFGSLDLMVSHNRSSFSLLPMLIVWQESCFGEVGDKRPPLPKAEATLS